MLHMARHYTCVPMSPLTLACSSAPDSGTQAPHAARWCRPESALSWCDPPQPRHTRLHCPTARASARPLPTCNYARCSTRHWQTTSLASRRQAVHAWPLPARTRTVTRQDCERQELLTRAQTHTVCLSPCTAPWQLHVRRGKPSLPPGLVGTARGRRGTQSRACAPHTPEPRHRDTRGLSPPHHCNTQAARSVVEPSASRHNPLPDCCLVLTVAHAHQRIISECIRKLHNQWGRWHSFVPSQWLHDALRA